MGGKKGKREKKEEIKKEAATIKTALFFLCNLGSFQEDNVFPP